MYIICNTPVGESLTVFAAEFYSTSSPSASLNIFQSSELRLARVSVNVLMHVDELGKASKYMGKAKNL